MLIHMATTQQEYINAIDETFPVAGEDNSSQGFRTNFQNIKCALTLGGTGSGASTPVATPVSTGTVFGYTLNQNAFLGHYGGNILTTGTASVAIGANALHANLGAACIGNVAIGISALSNLVSLGSMPDTYLVSDAGIYDLNTVLVRGFPMAPVDNAQRIVTGTSSSVTISILPTVPIASVTGLTALTVPDFGNNDDGYFIIDNIPFDIEFLGQTFITGLDFVYVGTNGYITFGTGSDWGPSGNSNVGGINAAAIVYATTHRFGNANSVQRIYTGVSGSVGFRTFRIVVEGCVDTTGVIGSPDIRAEFIFYEATPAQIDLIVEQNAAAGVIAPGNVNVQGIGNIAIGSYALCGSSSGPQNIGNNNIGIGTCALLNNEAGYNNIAVGYGALMNSVANGITSVCAVIGGEGACYFPCCGNWDNVALGACSLLSHVTGSCNVAIGAGALQNMTYGYGNVAIGRCAGANITRGICNTIIGSAPGLPTLYGTVSISAGTCERIKVDSNGLCINGSLFSSNPSLTFRDNLVIGTAGTTSTRGGGGGYGTSNILIGSWAGYCSNTGNGNFAIGQYALCCNSGGSWNFAQGYRALGNNSTGCGNFAQGRCVLLNNSTGNFNFAQGYNALQFNTAGCDNFAQGVRALNCNITGNGNIAIGRFSLWNTRGSVNIGLGCAALQNNTTGCYNIGLGVSALYGTTTGSNNLALGFSAGSNNTTGINNSFIGCGAQGLTGAASNTITLGNSSITTIRAQVTTISALSDCRDKTNITGIPIGLNFIREVNPVQFEWNMRDGAKVGVSEMGFIAQELDALQQKYGVESSLELVLKDNPDRLEATPGKLLPVIIKAIQELAAIVDQLVTK